MQGTLLRPRAWPDVRTVATIAVVGALLLLYVLMSAGRQWSWPAADAEAYWLAASNLRAGEPIYAGCPTCAETYRYAPWFAFAWVPLTFLPKAIVMAAWMAAMIVATLACLYPLVRGWRLELLAVGVIIGVPLLHNAWMGNVHSLMLLPLVYAIDRRSGPVWIALAASLKFVPIAYAAVFILRRQWGRAALTVALTAVLMAPMLAFDLSSYSSELGATYALWDDSPLIAGVLVAVAAFALWRWRHRPGAWVLAGALVMAISPRLHLSGMGYLLAGQDRDPAAAAPREDLP